MYMQSNSELCHDCGLQIRLFSDDLCERTWTEDEEEQIKPVWVSSKVRLKHVVAMLSPTPWGTVSIFHLEGVSL